ncbi:hypothetical protein OSTOST_10367, partial [Ostertagia ostertagi]
MFPGVQQQPPVPGAMNDVEFEEIMNRNRTVASSAISRAVADAAGGDVKSATETILTAISLIKQSRVAQDDRCRVLVASLQDTLNGIETKAYSGGGGSSRSKHRDRSRSRSRDRDRKRRRRSRSRSRFCCISHAFVVRVRKKKGYVASVTSLPSNLNMVTGDIHESETSAIYLSYVLFFQFALKMPCNKSSNFIVQHQCCPWGTIAKLNL